MNKFICLIVLVTLLSACNKYENYDCLEEVNYSETSLIRQETADRLISTVCKTLNSNELIGIQLSIRDSLGQPWNISMGFTDLQQSTRLENKHILRIGSVSKLYTSTLILRMAEEDIISLDQKISEFYPDIEGIEKITILHLLNHSSGIVDVFTIPSVFVSASSFPDKKWDPGHLVKTCMNKKLDFEPGSKHAYSNTNYIILGLIAEQLTGQKLPQLYKKFIFDPLELQNTSIQPYQQIPAGMQNGYVHHFALSLSRWYTHEPENTAWATIGFSAGALASSANELSAFTFALFSGGILEPESLDMMTDFQGDTGLGLYLLSINGRSYYGHEGEISGFESITAFDPETKTTISICCNTTPFDIYELLRDIDLELQAL